MRRTNVPSIESWAAFVVRRRQMLFQYEPHFHLGFILTKLSHRLARSNIPKIIIL